MRDFLPQEAGRMRHVEHVTRELAQLFGYEEVITPVVESYELLAAKSGEEIRKRMYAFEDLGGRRVALRPEFTAPVARLMATKMKNEPRPMRLFCVGSLYRYDEPQYGRFREFWQANYELMGSNKPEADAEILILTYELLRKLGLHNYWLKIGHVGIIRGILEQEDLEKERQNTIMQLLDKKQWNKALTTVRESGASQKCLTTLKAVLETRGKDASQVLGKVEENVKDYESAVKAARNLREITELTKESDATFEMSIEAGFARGLEYYTGMIFEPYVPEMKIALSGGGRYDKLVELFGGEPTPAVGVAQGIDRLTLAVKKQRAPPEIQERKRVAVIPIGENLRAKALELSLALRRAGLPVEVEVMGRTVSKALQNADRRSVTHAVIIGSEELKEERVVLRDMKKRKQDTVKITDLHQEILEA